MAGAGPIRRAEIEGHADQRDVEPGIAVHIRGAHKGCGFGEARNYGGIEGLELLRAHHVVLLFAGWAQGDTVHDTVPSDVPLTTKRTVVSRLRSHSALHPMPGTCLSPHAPQATQDAREPRGLTTGHGRMHGYHAHDRWLQLGRQSTAHVRGMLLCACTPTRHAFFKQGDHATRTLTRPTGEFPAVAHAGCLEHQRALAEGVGTVRQSQLCRALLERQVVGACEQRITQMQTRAQCLWPPTAVKVSQKGVEGEGKMVFMPVIECGRELEADPVRCRGPRQSGEARLPLGEHPIQQRFQHYPSRRMERERRVVSRRRILTEPDLAAAAAQRLPVEIAGACRFPLPPLGPLAHADTPHAIAYLTVAGVLEHPVAYGRLQRRRIGCQPRALTEQVYGHGCRPAVGAVQHEISLNLAPGLPEHPRLHLRHHMCLDIDHPVPLDGSVVVPSWPLQRPAIDLFGEMMYGRQLDGWFWGLVRHERPKQLRGVDHLGHHLRPEAIGSRDQVHGDPWPRRHLIQVRQLPTLGEPWLIRQYRQACLGEVGNGGQLGVITPGHHHEVSMPLLDDALQSGARRRADADASGSDCRRAC